MMMIGMSSIWLLLSGGDTVSTREQFRRGWFQFEEWTSK